MAGAGAGVLGLSGSWIQGAGVGADADEADVFTQAIHALMQTSNTFGNYFG